MSLRTVRNPHMKKSVVIIASALLFVDCGPETDCAVELFTLVIAIGLLDLARRLKDLHFYHELRGPEDQWRSEEHTSELQSRENLVCRLLLEKKKKKNTRIIT